MTALEAFPFKHMPTIVDLLAEGEVGIKEIAAATGMCSFDSREVSDMLVYLSSFGRVEHSETGWSILPSDEDAVYERFRQYHVKELNLIFSKLSASTKTVAQLSEETDLSEDTVDLYLPFLAKITRLGVISRCSTTYPVSWCTVSE